MLPEYLASCHFKKADHHGRLTDIKHDQIGVFANFKVIFLKTHDCSTLCDDHVATAAIHHGV